MKVYKNILPLDNDNTVLDQFGFLPLSIIEPSKQQNKLKWSKAYLNDGIKETRRSENAKYLPSLGFSEFHAELAEFIVLYWSVVGANIVDPFAGRVTRAYVSSKLGRNYYGYDISPTTVERVRSHLSDHNIDADVYNDNGCNLNGTDDEFAHLVMTCPPYHGLEKYESVDDQLSDIKEYDEFLRQIELTIKNIYRVLKPGGFVAWVCGDWRDGTAFRSFHSDSIKLFTENNLVHWDTIIVKNQSPFAAMQVGKVASKRYTSKVHEYLLVFRKEGELDLPTNKIQLENKIINKYFDF